MRSKAMEKWLRVLLILLGVGIGLALAQLGLAVYRQSHQTADIPAWVPMAAYTGMAVLGGLVLLLLSGRIIRRVSSLSRDVQNEFDKMPVNQLLSAVIGLILGLIVAALLRHMLSFFGDGIAGAALTAILYLTLGALGYNIGKRRSREFITMITRLSGAREKSRTRKHGYASRKYVDTSAIIDGRILEVAKTGFIEGEFVIPQYVVDELQQVADSADDSMRQRGRRGLEILRDMRDSLKQLIIDPADIEDIRDVDVKLLRQARDCGGTVITVDYNLQKAAAVSDVRSLNVNELAEAMRPAVVQGMEMRVHVTKEGKEPGQGVAHLDDGTMIVIENGRSLLGADADVIVTSVLQTSAGRMVFAKLKS